MLKLSDNINIFVTIILLICIIILFKYYTKNDYFTSNITTKMINTLDIDISLCFLANDNIDFSITKLLSYEFLKNNQNEFLDKMKEILLPALILMTRYVRLFSLDFICKNSKSSDKILRISSLFFKQIKLLIKLYNNIFTIASNYTLQEPQYDETELFKQLVCITNSKIQLNDQNILSDYDSITYPESISSQVLDTYSIYKYAQEIHNLILNVSQNKPIDYCSNIDLTLPKELIPVYRMYPDGDARSCKSEFFPKKSPTNTPVVDKSYQAKISSQTFFSVTDNVTVPSDIILQQPITTTPDNTQITTPPDNTQRKNKKPKNNSLISNYQQTFTTNDDNVYRDTTFGSTAGSSYSDFSSYLTYDTPANSGIKTNVGSTYDYGYGPGYVTRLRNRNNSQNTSVTITTPGSSTSGRTTSGRTTSGRTTSGTSTSGTSTVGRTTSGTSTSGTSTSGTSTVGRTTSGTSTSGTSTSGTPPSIYQTYGASSGSTYGKRYGFRNNLNYFVDNNSPIDTSLSSAYYIPQEIKTVKQKYKGVNNNKKYAILPSSQNINLENDDGHNNFFLPNIYIEY
jgi:hypothetical protein